jgi:rod shape-determining protein MreC
METGSRDDFVIAIRSVFLKKNNQQKFSLIVLIFFAIIIIILSTLNFKAVEYLKISIKEVIYRASFIISVPENITKKTYQIIDQHLELYDEQVDYKKEIEILKSKDLLNEFVISENKRLKSIVDDYLVSTSEIIAKILIDKQSPFLRSMVVNKGSKDKIKLGMFVLDGQYLVGKIVEVNYSTSRVLLLSDLNSKIPVIIEPNGIQSILSGTGKKHGIIQYLKRENKIEDPSNIYTSGSGGLFKAGIPIGKMSNLDENQERKIDFFSDFSQLEFVKITSFKKEEIK